MMSEGNRPVPVPRPRQLKSAVEPAVTAYENFAPKPAPAPPVASAYDNLNAQLRELKYQKPAPIPSPRTKVPPKNSRNYENAPESAKPLNNQPTATAALSSSPSRSTGAIRKVPNVPAANAKGDGEPNDFEVMSQSSSTSSKSSDLKFTTPSPS